MNQMMAFLLKALVRPLADLLPYWVPVEKLLAVLLVVVICVAVGAIFGTRIGEIVGNWIEKTSLNECQAMPSSAA